MIYFQHMDALDMAPLGDFLSPTDEFDITFLPQVQTNSSPEMEGILVMGQEQNSNADSNLQLTPSKRPCSTDCLTMPCDDVSLPPIKRKKRCDRRNCCFYCNCVLTNLTRHMVRQHPEEIEVARYIALLEVAPVETKIERQKIMESLRLRGNHVHNSSMINQPHSDYTEVLPIKRPPTLKEKSLSSYVSCKMCQGLFIRKTFFRHAQFCQGKSGIDPSLEEHEANELKDLRKKSLPSYIKVYGVSTCPKPNNVHSIMTETIMPRLWKDEIGQAAIKDRLILSTCNDFLKSHLDPKDHNQVARKMRDGSKLLLTIKEKDCAIKDFCDCFEPSKINIVTEAVRDLCGCEENGNVSVVGMPARLAWIIHECGKRLIDDTLCSSSLNKEEKQDIKQSVSDFLDLIKRRWQYEISTNAENSRKRKKMTKDRIMPDSDDVKCFSQTMTKLGLIYHGKLKESTNPSNYEMLCKLVIAQIIALNARRPLEAAKIQIDFFLKRQKKNTTNEELLSILTEDEMTTYHSLSEFHVPGKLEQECSILLTKEMETSIELIVECRPILKIPTTNQFLFARPGLQTPFDGSAVIREMRSHCKLKKPEFITCTGLRHHCATMALLKGKDFTAHMSKFMSHTLNVHNKNYCYPVDVINRGKIGHFMLGLNNSSDNSTNIAQPIGLPSTKFQETGEIVVSDNGENISQTPEIHNNTSFNDPTAIQDSDYQPFSDIENDEEEGLPPQRRRHNKRAWTEEDKSLVVEEFLDFVMKGKNPGPTKCNTFLESSGKLSGRTGLQLNSLIDNINRGKTKLPRKFEHLTNKIN